MSGAVEFTVDGRPVTAPAGASVAVAMLAAGRRAWRITATGETRGVFCGIGACFECTATIDGITEVRTCLTPVVAGMRVWTTGAAR